MVTDLPPCSVSSGGAWGEVDAGQGAGGRAPGAGWLLRFRRQSRGRAPKARDRHSGQEEQTVGSRTV